MNFKDPLIFSVPVFILLILAEWAAATFFRHEDEPPRYETKDLLGSAGTGIGVLVLSPLAKIVGFFVLFLVYNGTMKLRLSLLGYSSLGYTWWVWLLAFIGDDLTFYWHHRACHMVRLFWADHIVHHSSHHFNFGTGIRNSWGIMFYKAFFWIWMPLLGFHPLMLVTVMSVSAVYQFFLHTKYIPRLGFFEKFMNTPVLHQVHHARNWRYLDKNHGGILIVWDKLFGTFQDYDGADLPVFGASTDPGSVNPFRIISHEYADLIRDVKRSRSWKNKLKHLFYPPGWSHDNSTRTTAQIRRAHLEETASPVPEKEHTVI